MDRMTNHLLQELGEVVAALEIVTDGSYLERLANGQVIALQCVELIRTHHAALAAMVAERDGLRGLVADLADKLQSTLSVNQHNPYSARELWPDLFARVDTARQAAGEVA